MIFLIGQGLRRTYDNRVSGMDSYRVNILHIADGNGGIVGITHYLVLYFLVSLYAFLNQNLMYRRQHQGIFHNLP